MRIGIDVGGTHTDAVLLDHGDVRAWENLPTTADITGGILSALNKLVEHTSITPERVSAIVIGMTHFTNAVVQRRDLNRVGAIRIGLPASRSLGPFVDWPTQLANTVKGGIFHIEGGHEYDGRRIVDFDETATRKAARELAADGVDDVAIASVFSPLNDECEKRAGEILREEHPGVRVTLSKDLGRLGLLERENAALLNGAIGDLARRTILSFEEAIEKCGIRAPLYITQNDGTVMQASYAAQFPILSFASGPTNSMRGAAFLSGLDAAVVVDVGGTTTDIGCLESGFPREANSVVEIGGVRTLFRMPDLLSVGLGGGSIADIVTGQVGPHSVGYQLSQLALVFGGDVLTATDIAVAGGLVSLGKPDARPDLSPNELQRALKFMAALVEDNVDRVKSAARAVPVLAVGGGAFLVPRRIAGISEVIHVEHGEVANAVGAAIAQVSGEVDKVFTGVGREAAIDQSIDMAKNRALRAGAWPDSLQVVDVEDIPIAYVPGDARRVRVRVVGDINH